MFPSYTRLPVAAFLPLLLLLLQPTPAAAFDLADPDTNCAQAIVYIYKRFKWPGKYTNTYKQLCQEPNAVVSIYASVYTYCSATEVKHGATYLDDYCEERGSVPMAPASDYAANLTHDAIAQIRVLGQSDIKKSSNVTAPFVIAPAWYRLGYRTLKAWNDEERLHAHYTYAGYGFWGIVLLFGLVQNVVRKVVERRRGYVYADAEASGHASAPAHTASHKANMFVRAAATVRKYVLTPSALPPFHQQRVLGCTIPTRAEAFVVLAYWAVSIVLGAVHIHGFKNNLYYAKASAQVWRYLADRTGIMSYGNLPLIWAFSGRNNVFLWLTGWSFGTFNIFHRHIARIATLQAILHSIAYTGFYITAGYSYRAAYDDFWWTIGVVATVVMSLLVLFSFSVVRTRLYESFLLVHIVLSVLLLVFLYYHTNIFSLALYNHPFLISSAAVWGFDRFLRLVRQAYVNLHVHRRRRHSSSTTAGLLQLSTTAKATVSYRADGNMITIDVVPGNNALVPAPGQHYYLYQPLRLLGWENHPFTLGYWYHEHEGGDDNDTLHLQFWARPYDGWTKKLKNECIKRGDVSSSSSSSSSSSVATIRTPLLLEGPYGKSEPTHAFEEVLLVAGGSGIAGVFPYLLDHVRRTKQGAAANASAGGRIIPTRTRHITLIWADRSEAYLRHVADGPLADILGRADVTVSLYNSAGLSASSSMDQVSSTPGSAEKPVNDDDEKKNAGSGRDYTIHAGRPDVPESVRRLAKSIKGTDARLAVMVCGPAALADNVRLVVAQNMETDRDSIEYFEESFGW